MKWLSEILKGLENEKELLSEIKKGVAENFVPKTDFNAKLEEIKTLNTSIAERDTQLNELKKIDHEGLKNQIEALQQQNLEEAEKYSKQLEALTLDNAIKLKFTGKVHDADLATREFKSKFPTLKPNEEGAILGLDEAYSQFKEEKAFLFVQDDPQETKPGFQKIGIEPQGQGATGEDQIAAAFGNVKE